MPQRTFLDVGTRRILTTGFIGRRTELHRLRQRLREGERVFVLQGLGGLGKSTLALHMLRDLLARRRRPLPPLVPGRREEPRAPSRSPRPSSASSRSIGRQRFGSDWEEVVQQVDRAAGDDPAQRFACFLQALLAERRAPGRSISTTSNRSWSARTTTRRPDRSGRLRRTGGRRPWRPSGRSSTRFAEATDKLLRRRELPLPQRRLRRRPDPGPPAAGRCPVPPHGLVPRRCGGSASPGREPGWSIAWTDTPGRSSSPTT